MIWLDDLKCFFQPNHLMILWFVPIAPCLLHVAFCEQRASLLFLTDLEVPDYCDDPSTVRKNLTSSVFPHRAGCLAFWSSSRPWCGVGGKPEGGSVVVGAMWWVLPGLSWGIPRLSACWQSLDQAEKFLLLVSFVQIDTTPDGWLLLLLLLTVCPF